MKCVKYQVGNQVINQMFDHVKAPARNQMYRQVLDQMYRQVLDQVWDQVLEQVCHQVYV